jgi:hypothetical protein
MPGPRAALLALLLPALATALYATVPFAINAFADPKANNTGKRFDTTDCLAAGYVCELPPRNVDAPLAPTPVYIQIDMLDVTSVDEVTGTFIADFIYHVAWRDDRIQCIKEVLDETGGEVCQELVSESDWLGSSRQFFPRMDIMNAVDKAFDGAPVELIVKQRRPLWLVNQTWAKDGPEGPDNYESLTAGSWVLGFCRQRLTMAAKMSLRSYPFDRQNLTLVFQAQNFGSRDVRLVASPINLKSMLPTTAINGWEIKRTTIEHYSKDYVYSEENFAAVTLTIAVERASGQLLSRYVLGVSFLVLMAFLAITLAPNEPNRQTMQQASFLGVVAWQYVLVSSTPSMGYLTSLDTFFLVAFGHIFAAFAYCSIKYGYTATIDDLVRNNEAHAARAGKKALHMGAVALGADADAAAAQQPEDLPPATPTLVAWARAICRGLPAYVSGGGWAALNLHQRLDLVVMAVLSVTYCVSAAIALTLQV